MLDDGGTGPFNLSPQEDGAILLSEHDENEEEDGAGSHGPPILLRGEPAARAIARFRQGRSDLVVGGRIGDLPIARAAEPGAAALRFDPVGGLFGLTFTSREGPVADPAVRRALSLAVDRPDLVRAAERRGGKEIVGPCKSRWSSFP